MPFSNFREIALTVLGEESPSNLCVDVGFGRAFFKREVLEANRTAIAIYIKEHVIPACTEARFKLEDGPSYIHLGAAMGAQRDALILMAIGHHFGWWKIMTPRDVGITNEAEASKLMGSGFLMAAQAEGTSLVEIMKAA